MIILYLPPPQIGTFSFDIFLKTGIPKDKIRYVSLGLGVAEILTSISCVSKSYSLLLRGVAFTSSLAFYTELFSRRKQNKCIQNQTSALHLPMFLIVANAGNHLFLSSQIFSTHPFLLGSCGWAHREEAVVLGRLWCHVCILVVGHHHTQPEGKLHKYIDW